MPHDLHQLPPLPSSIDFGGLGDGVIGPFHINRPAFGDAMELAQQLPDESINCCVTSPPYWGLRDYGHDGQLGLEETPDEYVNKLVALFREIRRALTADGTLWLNLGDCYAGGGPHHGEKNLGKSGTNRGCAGASDRTKIVGLKPKDLVGIPWRVAFALQADGWYLRSDIIWSKPNPMPESVTDRPTKAHEYIFLMSKSERYFYDADAIRESATHAGQTVSLGGKSFSKGQAAGKGCEPSGNALHDSYTVPSGRNRRSVWTISTQPYPGAHFATFPPDLIKPCIMAGCPESGVVLDPFLGSGTTGQVCQDLGRKWIGFELNQDYEPLIKERTKQQGLFS